MEEGKTIGPASGASPIMAYRSGGEEPRVSREAMTAFIVSLAELPVAIALAVFFGAVPFIVLLSVGSVCSLSLGLASLKEIRESEGTVVGRVWAILGIVFSLLWPMGCGGVLLLVLIARAMVS